jgi:hypothetical protein
MQETDLRGAELNLVTLSDVTCVCVKLVAPRTQQQYSRKDQKNYFDVGLFFSGTITHPMPFSMLDKSEFISGKFSIARQIFDLLRCLRRDVFVL